MIINLRAWRSETLEQHKVDAYTQQRLLTNAEHVDHFKKRVLFPKLCFDYENLFVANQNADYGASYKDKKIKKPDYDDIYNPALNMDRFEFTSDGSISPLDKKAEKTIELFNLNNRILKNRRRDVFVEANNMQQQFSKDEIIELFEYEFHSGVRFILS